MAEKGVKKCPWCSRFVEKTEGCNFMRCHCTKEFCYNCGAIEIDDHKCINGCPIFDDERPEYRIRQFLDREIKSDEKEFVDKNHEKFIQKTQKDREFVI